MSRWRVWPLSLLVVWVVASLAALASPRPPAPHPHSAFEVSASSVAAATPCPAPRHALGVARDAADDPDDDPDPPGLPAAVAPVLGDPDDAGPARELLPPRPRMSSAQATGPPPG